MTTPSPFSTACPAASDSGSDLPPVERVLRLVFWTSAASRQLREQLARAAAAADLSCGELLTLWLCLGSGGGLVQGEVAAALGVSPAQMSGIVERLRQRGLIGMQRQALDRRRQVWRGTPAAQQLLQRAGQSLIPVAEQIDGRMSPAEQSAVLALCQQLAVATGATTTRLEHPSLSSEAA